MLTMNTISNKHMIFARCSFPTFNRDSWTCLEVTIWISCHHKKLSQSLWRKTSLVHRRTLNYFPSFFLCVKTKFHKDRSKTMKELKTTTTKILIRNNIFSIDQLKWVIKNFKLRLCFLISSNAKQSEIF